MDCDRLAYVFSHLCMGCETDGAPGWPGGAGHVEIGKGNEGYDYEGMCHKCTRELARSLVFGEAIVSWHETLHHEQRKAWMREASNHQNSAHHALQKAGIASPSEE